VLHRRRLADTGGVVVDQVALELLDLLVVEHHVGELADPRVDAVHDLVRDDLLLQHAAAAHDPLHSLGAELDRLAVPRHPHHVLDLQAPSVDDHAHGQVLSTKSRPRLTPS
jgi:hypothetical protein